MNGPVFILAAVLLIGVSGEVKNVVHKYSEPIFQKTKEAGVEAQKCIERAKIQTEDEKRYVFDQANDFYHYISNAVYILNKAVYADHLPDGKPKKDLREVTHQLSEAASYVLRAINDGQAASLKTKLKTVLETSTNKVAGLSRIASDVDQIYGVKLTEGDIYRATKALLRGFFQMKARDTFFGKSQKQIEEHVQQTGITANEAMGSVTGSGKHIALVLKSPVANLVDLIDRVLQRIDELLFDEETVTNTEEIRKVYQELSKLYGDTVELKIRFGYDENGEKLKADLNECSSRAGALFKKLTDLLHGIAGKEIVEVVLPQTETGVLFLYYYLDLYKVK